jgi:hypothetical protein
MKREAKLSSHLIVDHSRTGPHCEESLMLFLFVCIVRLILWIDGPYPVVFRELMLSISSRLFLPAAVQMNQVQMLLGRIRMHVSIIWKSFHSAEWMPGSEPYRKALYQTPPGIGSYSLVSKNNLTSWTKTVWPKSFYISI